MKKAALARIVLASAIGALGCNGYKAPTAPECPSVKVTPDIVHMNRFDTVTLHATGGDGSFIWDEVPDHSGFLHHLSKDTVEYTPSAPSFGGSSQIYSSIKVSSCPWVDESTHTRGYVDSDYVVIYLNE